MPDINLAISVDTADLAAAIVYDLSTEQILDLVMEIDDTVGEWNFTKELRDKLSTELAKIEDDDEKPMPAPWPFNIDDPVKAVHFASERECPYSNVENCPRHHTAREFIQMYEEWKNYR